MKWVLHRVPIFCCHYMKVIWVVTNLFWQPLSYKEKGNLLLCLVIITQVGAQIITRRVKKTFYAFSFLLAAERIEKMELLSLLPPTIIPRDYTYDDVCMTSDFSQPSTTKLKLIQHDSDNNFLCYIIFFEWEREWRCSFDFKMGVSGVVTQTQLLHFFISYLFYSFSKKILTLAP